MQNITQSDSTERQCASMAYGLRKAEVEGSTPVHLHSRFIMYRTEQAILCPHLMSHIHNMDSGRMIAGMTPNEI